MIAAIQVFSTRFRVKGGRDGEVKARTPTDSFLPAILFQCGLNQSMLPSAPLVKVTTKFLGFRFYVLTL